MLTSCIVNVFINTICKRFNRDISKHTKNTLSNKSPAHHRLIWCSYMCNNYVTYLNMYLFVCHLVYYQMINPLHPMPFLWLVSPYSLHCLGHKSLLVFPLLRWDECRPLGHLPGVLWRPPSGYTGRCHVRLLMMPVVSMTSASMPTYRPINYTIYITTCYEIVELHGNCLKYITSHLQTLNMFFFWVSIINNVLSL